MGSILQLPDKYLKVIQEVREGQSINDIIIFVIKVFHKLNLRLILKNDGVKSISRNVFQVFNACDAIQSNHTITLFTK